MMSDWGYNNGPGSIDNTEGEHRFRLSPPSSSHSFAQLSPAGSMESYSESSTSTPSGSSPYLGSDGGGSPPTSSNNRPNLFPALQRSHSQMRSHFGPERIRLSAINRNHFRSIELQSFIHPHNQQQAQSNGKPKCAVCSSAYRVRSTYGGAACDMCQAFFRQVTLFKRQSELDCKNGTRSCLLISWEKRKCPYCRYQKCLAVGMSRTAVLEDENRRQASQNSRNASTPLGYQSGHENQYEEGQSEQALVQYNADSHSYYNQPEQKIHFYSDYNQREIVFNQYPNQNYNHELHLQSYNNSPSYGPVLEMKVNPSMLNIDMPISLPRSLNETELKLLKEISNSGIIFTGYLKTCKDLIKISSMSSQDHIVDLSTRASLGIVRGAKKLSPFSVMSEPDKISLIKNNFVELMVLSATAMSDNNQERWRYWSTHAQLKDIGDKFSQETLASILEDPDSVDYNVRANNEEVRTAHGIVFKDLADRVGPNMYGKHSSYIRSFDEGMKEMGLGHARQSVRRNGLIISLIGAIVLMDPSAPSLEDRSHVSETHNNYVSLLYRTLQCQLANIRCFQPSSKMTSIYPNLSDANAGERVFHFLMSRIKSLSEDRHEWYSYFPAWAPLMNPLIRQILDLDDTTPAPQTELLSDIIAPSLEMDETPIINVISDMGESETPEIIAIDDLSSDQFHDTESSREEQEPPVNPSAESEPTNQQQPVIQQL